jgi:uncharacterized protein YoxC
MSNTTNKVIDDLNEKNETIKPNGSLIEKLSPDLADMLGTKEEFEESKNEYAERINKMTNEELKKEILRRNGLKEMTAEFTLNYIVENTGARIKLYKLVDTIINHNNSLK